MQAAAKVGLFVVIFIVLLIGGLITFGGMFFATPTTEYSAEFPDAGGVSTGTKVLMAGVQIGKVSKVNLVNPRLARITLTVAEDTKIPEGSVATLSGSLIGFGDNPIQIVPPQGAITTYMTKASPPMKGVKLGPLDNILPNSQATLTEVTKTLAATRKLLEDQSLKKRVEQLMDTSNKTLEGFNKLSIQTEGLIAENRSTLKTTLANAQLAMQGVNESTQIITKLLKKGQLQGEALALLEKLNKSANEGNRLLASLNTMVGDQALQSNVKQTAANVEKITDSGTRIAEQGEKISENATVLSKKAIELTDKVNGLLDDVRDALGGLTTFFKKSGNGPKFPIVQTQLDLQRETNPNYWRTDLNVRIPTKDGAAYIGLFDAFESNKINLQLAKTFDKNGSEYRYGIYASKPALGVDFRIAHRFSIRGDLFNINAPRFDLRAGYDFGNGVVGFIGVNRVLNRNSPTIGIGIRR